MIDINLLKRKIAQLGEYLADLQELQEISFDEFKADKKIHRYAERTFHLAIECCLDIGSHLISDNGWREPVDNKDIFTVLGENAVLEQKSLPNLQKMAQFRNVLVHDYTKLDLDIVYNALQHNLSDIRNFVRDIKQLI